MAKKRRDQRPPGEPPRSGGERSGGERSEPERSEPERSGGSPGDRAPAATPPPDPEVSEQARRRRFTAEYKLRIVQEADALTQLGDLGALLRREGLYSSHLSTWRRQRDEGSLSALSPKRRGRKLRDHSPLASRVAELERDNENLRKRLREAETIIEVQKKLSEVLGIAPQSHSAGRSS